MADNNSAVEYFLSLADEAERVITKDAFAEKLSQKSYKISDEPVKAAPVTLREEVKVAVNTPRRASERFSLRDSYLNCHSCPLWMNRNNITHPQIGAAHPLVLFVFPYMLEDGSFLSASEMDYFKKWLSSICLETKEAGLTSVVKCPGGDIGAPSGCLDLLKQQIALTKPKCIVFFSTAATLAEALHDRGVDFTFEGVPAISTYSPGEVLDDLSLKKDIWTDLKHVAKLAGIEERRSRA